MARKEREVTSKGYAGYVKAYQAKAAMLEKHGGAMRVEMLSEVEWRHDYKKYRNTFREEVAEGTRKQIGNINQYMISDQAYFMSAKQARNIVKGLSQTTVATLPKVPELKGLTPVEAAEAMNKYHEEKLAARKEYEKQVSITSLRSGHFDWKKIKGSLGWKDFLSQQYQQKKKEAGTKAAEEYIQDFFFGGSPT